MIIKVAFIGDMAFYGKYDTLINDDLEFYFSDVKKVLSECDYSVGNLEAPFIKNAVKFGFKSAYISSDPINVNLLNYLGINSVCISNNHIYDYGRAGLNETIETLDSNGIDWFGVNNKDLVIDSLNLAFHGYCSYNTNPSGLRRKFSSDGVEPLKYSKVESKFCKYLDSGYLNILSVHSGIEHINQCSMDDVRFARKFAKKGSYIYFGHHPHVLQAIENYEGSLLAYSLGNFCFDDVYEEYSRKKIVTQSEDNKSSVIMIASIDGNKIVGFETVSIYQGSDKLEVGGDLSLSKLSEANKLLHLSRVDYQALRADKLKSINASRNSSRSLEWLVNRIRFSTIRRVVERKVNSLKYKLFFSSKL